MTIPSRPAPPPPQPQTTANNNLQANRGVQKLSVKLPPPIKNRSEITKNYGTTNTSTATSITRNFPPAKTRYAPTTNWSGSSFHQSQGGSISTGITDSYRKCPPPRPPPPKVSAVPLKKPGAPLQSVNVLSNLFGRKKPKQQLPPQSINKNHNFNYGANSFTKQSSYNNNPIYPANSNFSLLETANSQQIETDCQLISFDSPPSSPTLTQKSNSDCLSVDSFSSDSNFSSPNNGSVSQPESGFEDDFSASRSTTSPLDPWEALDTFSTDMSGIYGNITNDLKTTAPVRNLDVINSRIQSSTDNHLCNGKSLLPPVPTLSMPTIIKPKISQKPKAPNPPINKTLKACGIGSYGYHSTIQTINRDEPPMPSCPPPPPPSNINLLDVIKGNLDAINLDSNQISATNESPYGIALYDFDGIEDTDLSFKANEKIYILQELNDEWTMGRNRRGCEGMFPSNYIDIQVSLPLSATDSNSKQPTKPHQIKSLYTFVAEQPEDLSLNENDLVTVLYQINEDWLFGEVNGRQGQFPANFLEHIPNDIPMS